MKIQLINTGKTTEKHVKEGVEIYATRLKNYVLFEYIDLPEIKQAKNVTFDKLKELEGEIILKKVLKTDYVVVLDEKGLEYGSTEFAGHLQKIMNRGIKNMAFVTGGPYGFSRQVYDRANDRISLSRMTFPHQLVRLIFIEQLYRSFTILNNEPYHHI
ncbi:MAG: 23S rRNA (pseudouridine(1915)-N(3))-methyltransferase RlmH [Bacteroidales bacterium]